MEGHNEPVSELKARIDELVELMEEFSLDHASLKGPGWSVEFGVHAETRPAVVTATGLTEVPPAPIRQGKPKPSVPSGTPVTSPMTGIYYSSSSPGAPQFVRLGEAVVQGQVVGLIEAMKVFNEIFAPVSGLVTKIAADNGQLVQPGDPLVYIN